MRRPFWVWIVLLLSLFNGCSSIIGSVWSLSIATDGAVESMVKSREEFLQFSQLPVPKGHMGAYVQALDQAIARMSELEENPLYIAYCFIVSILTLALGVGFVVGVVRLYRLQLPGVTTLQVCHGGAMALGIISFVVPYRLGVEVPVPTELGMEWVSMMIGMIFMAIFVAFTYLLPLVLLTFCSKADFESHRD